MSDSTPTPEGKSSGPSRWHLGRLFGGKSSNADDSEGVFSNTPKWSFGVLNDPGTVEVPGK
jgi:hypothetical protein